MNKKIFSIVLIIATLFMGVGYASINAISLDISGEVIAQAQEGIFITEIKYNEKLSNNVLVTDSKINSSYQTNLDSNIVLTNNSDSQITYDITIYNSNDISYYFDKVEYTLGSDTYSNANITFMISGLNYDQELKSKGFVTFNLTFFYEDDSLLNNNILKSILNFKFKDFICPNDGRVCDISGNGNHATVVGADWNKESKTITTDGIDDYIYLENLVWDETTEFTVDFVAKIPTQNTDLPVILFESSVNSNFNDGSFYIDTNEYGNNDITVAMKYLTVPNHKIIDNVIDNENYRHYTVTFNSLNDYDKFTNIYFEGIEQPVITTPGGNGIYDNNLTGKTISNNPFYIASRAGEEHFAKISLKELRIYKKELSQSEILSNKEGNIVEDGLLLYYDFG